MKRFVQWISRAVGIGLGLAVLATQVAATPVVYTLQTVGDGKLGNHAFNEALITIVMTSDTRNVQTTRGPNGNKQFVNRTGQIQITVNDRGQVTTATFAPGEVYVFYDTVTGIAGVGSAISPSYPFALDCADSADGGPYVRDCAQGDWAFGGFDDGTLAVLATPYDPALPPDVTPQTLALPKSLADSTLLTGRTHSCATTYTVDAAGYLGVCGGPAPRGLRTDQGLLFLQDKVGGSNPGVGPYLWGLWDTSNVGYLHVEVIGGR
jgi:hypothetical protein